MRFDHILIAIKVVSCIKEGEKLATRSGILSIDKKPQSFMRWINGDSRNTTLVYVNAVVTEAIIAGITKDLLEMIEGLKSLKVTYMEDEATVAYLDIIIDKILDTNKNASKKQ